jgi:hypothetical protein
MFQVINRCFQILQAKNEAAWRTESDLVIAPDVRGKAWDAFGCGTELIEQGEAAALEALPVIQGWLGRAEPEKALSAGAAATDSVPV